MDRYCIVVSIATELGTQESNFLSGTLHNSVWSHKPAGGRLFVACRDHEPSRVKWREIQDCATVSVADTVLECCVTGDSGQYEMADIVHSLCDQLPRFGYFLDLFWIFYEVRDSFSLPLEICSALLRLSEWHRGKITLLSADERVQLGLPAELQSEFGNLAAVRSSFGDAAKQQVCWRGSIIIGSAVLEDCSLRCLNDGCEVTSSGLWPGVALSTNPEATASISADDSMAASSLVFNSIIDLDDVPIALMCHQTYVLEVPQNAGNVLLPSWKALLEQVAKQKSGILLKLDWLQPLPAHTRHGKWSIDDVEARNAGKLFCSQLTTRNWETYVTEEENAQCIAESCCSRSVSHCFLLLTPADWSDGVDGVSTVLATCLRQPDVASGTLPRRRSCYCRCRCVGRGLALPFVDPERLLDAFVPPGSPSTWQFYRRPADGAHTNAATTTASAAAADAKWDTSSSMWPERRLLEERALQGDSYRRRSQSPSAATGDRHQLGGGLCLTLNEMARRLSMSLRESSNLAVSDGSSGNASRLPAHVCGCGGPIVPPADAAKPWPTSRLARGPGVHYHRGECSEEEEVRLRKFRVNVPPHRETSSSFNASSSQGFPIFVPQAAKGMTPLQSCPPLKSRKLDKSSKCTTGAEKTLSDRTRFDRPFARTSCHPSSSASPSPSSLSCRQVAFARSAPAAYMQPSTSRRTRNEVVETSGGPGPIKRSQHVDRMRSQSIESSTVADRGSDDLSERPPRERESSTTALATSAKSNPPGDQPRSKESRSERHKRRLLDIVTNVLKRKGVTPESNPAFAACQQRLFNTVKGFVQDLPNSHSLGDNMRRLAEKFCGEVIEFETSVLMSKRAATHAPD